MQISLLKLSSFALLFVFFASLSLAQSRQAAASFRPAIVSDSFNKNFEGTLDNKIKIRMNLIRHGRELSGSYLYEKYGKNIVLKGIINENGYFEIKEYDEKNAENGSFYGAFTSEAAMVGFWTKDAPISRSLSFHLIESGKQSGNVITGSNTPAKLECQIKNDNGDLTILMIGGTIIAFEYNNVGTSLHLCGLYADRVQKGVVWEANDLTAKITFTKEFFEDENTAEIVIKKNVSRYDITFSGEFGYFCGAKAFIPPKVAVYRSGKIWVGKALYR